MAFSRFFSKPPAVPKITTNSTALSGALQKYIQSIRNIRASNPFATNLNSVLSAANHTNVNRTLTNYILRANGLNTAVAKTLPQVKAGNIPPTVAAPLVSAAAAANTRVVKALPATPATAILSTITNNSVSNNTKLNAKIKEFRGRYKNMHWNTVNRNKLTNAQKKVLNALTNPLWTGIKRVKPLSLSETLGKNAQNNLKQLAANKNKITTTNTGLSYKSLGNGRFVRVTANGAPHQTNRRFYIVNYNGKFIPTANSGNVLANEALSRL